MKDDNNRWCVYIHTNKINGKKYIGITGILPQDRWRKNGSGYRHQLFGKAIKKYGWNGFYHDVIFENLSLENACQTETELIEKYKTYDRKYGYNVTRGGDAANNNINAKKVYQYDLMGNFIKEYPSISEAERIVGKGISSCINGRAKTAFNYQWYNEYLGEKIPYKLNRVESIIQSQNKIVYQYSINGKYIRKYESIKQASEITGIERTGISNCIHGKQKSHKGYIWKSDYHGKTINSLGKTYNKPKTIYQYSINGEYIQKFNSLREARRYFGFAININNKTNISHGYRWVTKYYGKRLPDKELMLPSDMRGLNYWSAYVKKDT